MLYYRQKGWKGAVPVYRVLIVEDDETIAREIQKSLNKWGLESVIAADLRDVTGTFRAYGPHLVLMDISLPYYSGFYWCAEIRKVSSAPVIFLSSHTENMDILMAVNMGGDDYITKPVAMEILTAKIQAMLRRSYDYRAASATLSFCGATLDIAASRVTFGDRQTDLTKNELKILQVLLENRNAVTSREQIMLRLWDSDCFVDENTLTVNMNRLRKTLGSVGMGPCIVTYKGRGYGING